MIANKMMEEVWRWKDEVAQEIEGMNVQQRIAYFRESRKRLEEKIGKKLELHTPKSNKTEKR